MAQGEVGDCEEQPQPQEQPEEPPAPAPLSVMVLHFVTEGCTPDVNLMGVPKYGIAGQAGLGGNASEPTRGMGGGGMWTHSKTQLSRNEPFGLLRGAHSAANRPHRDVLSWLFCKLPACSSWAPS